VESKVVEKQEKDVEKEIEQENERQRSVNLFFLKREQKEEEKGGIGENPLREQKDEKDNKHKSMIFNI
jgi:hypothetical protein